MMRLLHVLDHSLPEQSGYAFRSHSILRELLSRGLEVEALTSPKQGVGSEIDEIDGVTYWRTPVSEFVSTTGVAGQLRTIRLTRKLIAGRLRVFSPDVIHAHSPCLNGLAALGLGKPLLYEMRSSWEDAAVSFGATTEGSLRYRASRLLETFVASRADAVAVICDGLKTELTSRGIPGERITVVPNALPPEMFDVASAEEAAAIRRRFGLEHARIIGFFGSFFEWEGVDALITAMRDISAAASDVYLLLAGGGRHEAELRALAKQYGLDARVIFAGRIPHVEVPAFYAAADVMAYPRVSERLTEMVTPLKPLEAMAQGTPVVASDVGGHRELIRDGKTGFLYPAGDARALSATLLRVLGALDETRPIVAEARLTVERERRWSTVADRYLPLYERLVEAANRKSPGPANGRAPVVPGRGVSTALARRIGTVLSPAGRRARLAVFCYHQTLQRKDPLRPSEPDEDEFANDIDTILSVFNVMSLGEAVRRLKEGTLPARSACITFDDGYANNHEIAAPMLQARGVPATFFVAGGAIDTGVMWNDLVIEGIARRRGDLVLGDLGKPDDRFDLANPGPELVLAVLGRLKYLPLDLRWARARDIFRLNTEADLPRLMMTREMVADLARRGFEIGGHTISHPILKELADEHARHEIESCSQWIADVAGHAPRSFAYPNGRPGTDFDARHAAMAAAAGFDLAVTTEWSIADGSTDPYSIPRIGPWWRQDRTVAAGALRLYAKHYLQAR